MNFFYIFCYVNNLTKKMNEQSIITITGITFFAFDLQMIIIKILWSYLMGFHVSSATNKQ